MTSLPHPQQYASRRAGTEGAASSLDAAAALQDGRVTPASQVRLALGDLGRGLGTFLHVLGLLLAHE